MRTAASAIAVILSCLRLAHAEPKPINCPQDIYWLDKMARTDMVEMNLGNFAQTKAKETSVRTYGTTIIADLSRNLNELLELAQAKGINFPYEPNAEQKIFLNYFENSHSADWGYDYMKFAAENHEHIFSETNREVLLGCDEDVRRYAVKMLPLLKAHLNSAEDILVELNHP